MRAKLAFYSMLLGTLAQEQFWIPFKKPANEWEPLVDTAAKVQTSSTLECATICLANLVSCKIFILDGTNCYMGKFGNSLNVVGPRTYDTLIHVSKDYLSSWKISFTELPCSEGPIDIWKHIFTSDSDVQLEIECALKCVELCDFFTLQGTICHLGQSGQAFEGPNLPPLDCSVWKVWTSLDFEFKVGSKFDHWTDMDGSRLSLRIYQDLKFVTLNECRIQCIFDTTSACQYVVFDKSNCYLGHQNASLVVNVTLAPTQNVFIYTEASFISALEDKGFALTNFSGQVNFIQGKAPFGVATDELCLQYCLLNSIPCHFSRRIDPDVCFIGSLNESLTANNEGYPNDNGSVFFNLQELISFELASHAFLPMAGQSDLWSAWVYQVVQNRQNVHECAIECLLLANDICDFFVHINQSCALGNYAHTSAVWESPIVSTVHVLKEFPMTAMQFQPAPNTQGWHSKIFQVIPDLSRSNCEMACLLWPRECSLYVHLGTFCYLGDWNVDAEVVVMSLPATLYGTKELAALRSLGIPEDSTRNSEVFMHDATICEDHGIPLFPPQVAQGIAMVNVDSIILSCGGEIQENYLDLCFALDLNAQKRSWVSRQSMPAESSQGLLMASEEGFVYALGGRSNNVIYNNVHKYDAKLNTWESNVATLPTAGYAQCAVEHNNEFYIIGGYSGSSFIGEMYIFSAATGGFRKTVPLAWQGREYGYCAKFVDANSGNWQIIFTGGYDGNDITDVVDLYDIENDGQFRRGSRELPAKINGGWGVDSMFAFNNNKMYLLTSFPVITTRTNYYLEFNVTDVQFHHLDLLINAEPKIRTSNIMIPLESLWTCHSRSKAWTLILNHDNRVSPDWFDFAKPMKNDADPSHSIYSIMGDIENFRSCNGQFHFRMVWPELGYYNEWWQTNNPVTTSEVSGFKAVALKFGHAFNGLFKNQSNTDAQMLGSDHAPWFGLGMTINIWNNGMIPGPIGDDGIGIQVGTVKLLVLNLSC